MVREHGIETAGCALISTRDVTSDGRLTVVHLRDVASPALVRWCCRDSADSGFGAHGPGLAADVTRGGGLCAPVRA